MTGVPQAMASIITRPKGSGQEMGKKSSKHGEMGRNVPGKHLVQLERYLSAWDDFRACFAIPASKQHYLMTALNQRVA